MISGTSGLAADGSLAGDMTGQATRAWQNVETTLNQAGAALSDIVRVRKWLTRAEDVRAYADVRSKFITHKPAFMLGVIPGLVRPGFLVEIEVVAGVPAGRASRDQCGEPLSGRQSPHRHA